MKEFDLRQVFEPKKKSRVNPYLVGSLVTVAIAALGAAYAAMVKFLMNVAFSREEPKPVTRVKRMISASEKHHDVVLDLETAAKKLEEEGGCEEIKITSRDGIDLVAHYRRCPSPKRIIIAMHGWRASWSRDFGTVADEWYEGGCDVVYCEQRGQNNSGGENMSFGILEREDCLEWVRWAIGSIPGELPIYLAGVSMGASTVLMATGLDLPDRVHGVLADCGFTSPDAIWKHVMQDNLHMFYDSALYKQLCKQRIGVDPGEYSTTDILSRNNIPVFFAHGTDDSFVPVSMTYENYKACRAPKRLFIVPGAEHGLSHYVDPEGYHRALFDFFAEFDGVTPQPRIKSPAEIAAAEAEEKAAAAAAATPEDGTAGADDAGAEHAGAETAPEEPESMAEDAGNEAGKTAEKAVEADETEEKAGRKPVESAKKAGNEAGNTAEKAGKTAGEKVSGAADAPAAEKKTGQKKQ